MNRIEAVTAVLLLWGTLGASWVTWRVFGDNPPDVPGGTAAAYATLFAVPPILVEFYKWARRWYEKRNGPRE